MKRDHQQAIEEIEGQHQKAIGEKDAAIALLNDDLKNRKYENLGLQGELRSADSWLAKMLRSLFFR